MALAGLAEALEHTPERPLRSLDVMTPAERQQLIVEWNDTAHQVPLATLPVLFEAQAGRSPDAVALVFEEERLSYAELNRQANRLAHHLIGMGIGPEDHVALCLERSPAMVVTLLAILKAGAAYVPLDPDYPAERLAFMLKDARPKAVVTTAVLADGDLFAGAVTPLVRLDSADVVDALAQAPATDPTDADRHAALLPNHPAYVIYTSGSTGMPKGVVWGRCQPNALQLLQQAWIVSNGRRPRAAKPDTLSFDFIRPANCSPPCLGPPVVVPDRAATARYRSAWHRRRGASYHTITCPEPMRAILNDKTVAGYSVCRRWISSGEALQSADIGRFQNLWPTAILLNLYGASEAEESSSGLSAAGCERGGCQSDRSSDLEHAGVCAGWWPACRCRWVFRASCTSRVRGWRGDISTVRT